jgi:hypothetical protein
MRPGARFFVSPAEVRARTPAPAIRTTGAATARVHSERCFSPSTPWGERSYPESLHSVRHDGGVRPAQLAVYLCATAVHSLWRTEGPSTPCQSCPPAVPRTRALVPRLSTVRHRDIPSSTTSIHISPERVKEATQRCQRGWGEPPSNLGTPLGKTWGQLNCPVGEASYVHSRRSFSTGGVPRQCGQKRAPDQRRKGLSTVSTTPTTTTPRIEPGHDRQAGGGQICG